MGALLHPQTVHPEAGSVVTKAVIRATDQLGVTARILSVILGVSEATVSRMKSGQVQLDPSTKPFELAVLFVRMFRSLDAIVGGDMMVARRWLANPNRAIDGRPIEKLQSISGLTDVIAYLDARRAIV